MVKCSGAAAAAPLASSNANSVRRIVFLRRSGGRPRARVACFSIAGIDSCASCDSCRETVGGFMWVPRSLGTVAVDHPVRAEAIGEHPEAQRPGCFGDRQVHLAAFAECREQALGL